MTDVMAAIDMRKSKGRSAVTNGKRLLPGVDGRSRAARRFRDVLEGFLVQYDALDEATILLCKELARLTVKQEQRAAASVRGERIDDLAATTDGNSIRRLVRDLEAGHKARRRARSITP